MCDCCTAGCGCCDRHPLLLPGHVAAQLRVRQTHSGLLRVWLRVEHKVPHAGGGRLQPVHDVEAAGDGGVEARAREQHGCRADGDGLHSKAAGFLRERNESEPRFTRARLEVIFLSPWCRAPCAVDQPGKG